VGNWGELFSDGSAGLIRMPLASVNAADLASFFRENAIPETRA
jgi:hypothetical protein